VLPNAHNNPPLLTQRFRYEAIPQHVCCEFLFPKFAVVDRHGGVLRASVPEAAINENGNAFPAKYKIRSSEEWLVPSPASNAVNA